MRFGYDATPAPMTDSQIADLYDKVIATATCLKEHDVDPGDPPSLQQFTDQAHDIGGWDPYTDIYRPGGVTEQEYFDLLAVCPRTW